MNSAQICQCHRCTKLISRNARVNCVVDYNRQHAFTSSTVNHQLHHQRQQHTSASYIPCVAILVTNLTTHLSLIHTLCCDLGHESYNTPQPHTYLVLRSWSRILHISASYIPCVAILVSNLLLHLSICQCFKERTPLIGF